MVEDLPALLQELPALLSPIGKRVIDPASPAAMRQMGAKGIAPGLKPGEALMVLLLLRTHADVAEQASHTLAALPAPLLQGALGGDLPAIVLESIAPYYAEKPEFAAKILAHPNTGDQAVLELARRGNETVCELVAVNEERLLACPAIIETLYKNSATRMSTCDRMIELAARNGVELSGISVYKEVVASLEGEPIYEPTDEPNYDDQAFVLCENLALSLAPPAASEEEAAASEFEDPFDLDLKGEEVVKKKFEEVKKRFEDMKTSAKIRIALTTKSASVRNMALRDGSPLVRKAAVRAEGFTDAEAEAVAARKNSHEDVLREIGMSNNLTRRHKVKVNLVMNPRTPVAIAQRFLVFLRDHELRDVASSRDVSGAIGTAAKQILARKEKKK